MLSPAFVLSIRETLPGRYLINVSLFYNVVTMSSNGKYNKTSTNLKHNSDLIWRDILNYLLCLTCSAKSP